MESDANLAEVGNFRKYENGFLRRWGEDIGRIWDAAGAAQASSKPPPPKATITYWRYHQVGREVEKGKGERPKGVDSKGVD